MRTIEARTTLSADTSSAREARRFLDRTLGEWGCAELSDVAVLLVSEIVTNAVLHARTTIELVLHLRESRLRVEVLDGNRQAPVRKHYDDDAATGRGLMIVESLASDWGVEPRSTGKVVWFELPMEKEAAGW